MGWAEAGLVCREGGLLLPQWNEANYRSVGFLEKLGLLLTEATDLPCWDPLRVSSRTLPYDPRTPETRNITASVSNAKIICCFSIKQEALEWRRDFQIQDARPLPPSKTPLPYALTHRIHLPCNPRHLLFPPTSTEPSLPPKPTPTFVF